MILFAGVHDSYWTHACDVDRMNLILRQKFVELYRMPILENVRVLELIFIFLYKYDRPNWDVVSYLFCLTIVLLFLFLVRAVTWKLRNILSRIEFSSITGSRWFQLGKCSWISIFFQLILHLHRVVGSILASISFHFTSYGGPLFWVCKYYFGKKRTNLNCGSWRKEDKFWNLM